MKVNLNLIKRKVKELYCSLQVKNMLACFEIMFKMGTDNTQTKMENPEKLVLRMEDEQCGLINIQF